MTPAAAESEFARVVRVKRLLTKAKKGLPETCSFYNTLYMHTKFLDKCEFFIPQDKRLDTIIMWKMAKIGKATRPKHQQVGLLNYDRPEAVMKLLNKTRLLDWTLPTSFLHLPAPLVDPITQMLQRKFTGHTHTWRGTQFIMDKKSQKGVPLRCPSGYRLAHLGKRGITLMLKTSQFSSVYTLAEFQDFSANVPCVGLFLDPSQKEDYTVDKKLPQADDADFPILYVAVCYSGAIGMLGCDENHWQDGLVGLLVQVCGRLMADMGLISNICVQDSNVTLRSVMDLLPGWETGSAVTRAWTCDGTLCP